jgi:hypothetical protein
VQPFVASRAAGVRPRAKFGAKQQPAAGAAVTGLRGPEPGDPRGRLVDQHPRVVQAPGDQQVGPAVLIQGGGYDLATLGGLVVAAVTGAAEGAGLDGSS